MLVYACFQGDDIGLAWRQHDLYDRALAVIVFGCRATAAGKGPPQRPFDHRALQAGHDILAAVWRYRALAQGDFFAIDDWLPWLASEVAAWPTECPRLTFAVLTILEQQNTPAGHAAEDRLREGLFNRFTLVPLHAATAATTPARIASTPPPPNS